MTEYVHQRSVFLFAHVKTFENEFHGQMTHPNNAEHNSWELKYPLCRTNPQSSLVEELLVSP